MTEHECPECGGTEWVTHSDGLGDVASVAAICVNCGYLTARVVDLSAATSPPPETPVTDERNEAE